VLSDPATRERLAALPFGALLELLRSERTAVAYESTAVAVAGVWLAEHSAATPEMRRTLAGEMRLAAMTPTFLTAQLPATPWFADAVPAAELQLATAAILGAKRPGQPLHLVGGDDASSAHAGAQAFKATRPMSAVTRAVLPLILSEQRVKAMLLQAANGDVGDVPTALSEPCVWGGFSWILAVRAMRSTYERPWALVAQITCEWGGDAAAAEAPRTVANVTLAFACDAPLTKIEAAHFIAGDGAAETPCMTVLAVPGWNGQEQELGLAAAGLKDGALRIAATVSALG
jgi:hypothetical protein